MKPSRKRLIKSLNKTISKWINEQAEGPDWIDGFVHDTIVEDMTDAAFIVLISTVKIQDYLKREKVIQ